MTLVPAEPGLIGSLNPPVPAPDLAAAFQRALGEGVVPGWRGLLAAPRPVLATGRVIDLAGGPVDKGDLIELPHPVLTRRGMVVARYPEVPGSGDREQVLALRAALLAEAQRVLAEGAHRCQAFLAARRSGEHRLSAHPVVANQLAGAVAAVAVVRYVDMNAALSSQAGREWLVCAVDDAAAALVRLAGGRSLLAGHLVALRTGLLTVNRIYLGGGACTRWTWTG